MHSFNFPSMLDSSGAKLNSKRDAVRSNILLLLQTEQGSLFGDPYFGTQLKKYIFEQSSSIVPDLVIDNVLNAIVEFIPQVYIRRDDIELSTNGKDLFLKLKYVYIPDNTEDIYTINLTENDN